MRKFLLLLALCLPASASWTLQVHAFNATNCSSSSGTSCSITATLHGGGLLVMGAMIQNTDAVSGVSGACSGSWTLDPGNAHYASDPDAVDSHSAYCVGSTAGSQTVTFSLAVSGSGREIMLREYTYTASSVALDATANSQPSSNGASPQPGASITTTGSSDIIVEMLDVVSANYTSVASPFGNADAPVPPRVGMDALNQAAGTYAPSVTLSTTGRIWAVALAFKEVSAAAGVRIRVNNQ